MAVARFPTSATVAILVVVACGIALGLVTSPAAADEHTFEEADDFTDQANFTVEFPFTTDHYPGDQNEANGSIQYFVADDTALAEVGAPDGAFIDTIMISSDWADYSECDVDNTAAFGIDRGNNNSGTNFDENLLDRMESNEFRDDGLTVWFYEFGDFAGDPPFFHPDDAIVAEQGARSQAGACLTLTSEPGWYQIQGFINGTVADNGPDEEPSEDANEAGLRAKSNYLYVCECDSEEEAREELGPPPGEEPENDEDTPTPTPTLEPANGDDTPTPTEPDDKTPTPTELPEETPTPTELPEETPTPTELPEETPTPTDSGEGATGGEDSGEEEPITPAPDGQSGFGAVAALVALFGSGLLAYRRG